MKADFWSVVIVTRDQDVGERVSELLRGAGAPSLMVFTDSEAALTHLAHRPANVLVASMDAQPAGGLEWVCRLRRQRGCRAHKAPIFLLADALTPAVIESCRNAGANAVIAPPLQRNLLSAIKKVLARPRPFIDEADYVGPCRRSAIITGGAIERRAARR